ncbi:MAG: hypothetical protein K9K67_16290 [Bacteriovoracaceae bacterium]|nr:hypothetical protein [Bacteriovoracaceae bacterium]
MITQNSLYRELSTASYDTFFKVNGEHFHRDDFIKLVDAYTKALFQMGHISLNHSIRFNNFPKGTSLLKAINHMTLKEIYIDYTNIMNNQMEFSIYSS